MILHGEIESLPELDPELDPELAQAVLAAFARRHEVEHLIHAERDEPDALARIAPLLSLDEATISRVLDQPLRWMLPQFRSELDSIAARVAGTDATTTAAESGAPRP